MLLTHIAMTWTLQHFVCGPNKSFASLGFWILYNTCDIHNTYDHGVTLHMVFFFYNRGCSDQFTYISINPTGPWSKWSGKPPMTLKELELMIMGSKHKTGPIELALVIKHGAFGLTSTLSLSKICSYRVGE